MFAMVDDSILFLLTYHLSMLRKLLAQASYYLARFLKEAASEIIVLLTNLFNYSLQLIQHKVVLLAWKESHIKPIYIYI